MWDENFYFGVRMSATGIVKFCWLVCQLLREARIHLCIRPFLVPYARQECELPIRSLCVFSAEHIKPNGSNFARYKRQGGGKSLHTIRINVFIYVYIYTYSVAVTLHWRVMQYFIYFNTQFSIEINIWLLKKISRVNKIKIRKAEK